MVADMLNAKSTESCFRRGMYSMRDGGGGEGRKETKRGRERRERECVCVCVT